MSDSPRHPEHEKPNRVKTAWNPWRSLSISRSMKIFTYPTPLPKFPSSIRHQFKIKIIVALGLLVLLVLVATPRHAVATARLHGILRPAFIPRIVHYVCIRKDSDSVIDFSFSSLISVFASILYIALSKIYIHTDFDERAIVNATLNGSHWTRKLLSTWPDLIVWNHVRVPNFAGPNDDHRIDAIQHKSDFVRWDKICDIGGIYMDFDVVTLKPLTCLLDSGFAFIAGRHYGGWRETGAINGTINNGVFLTRPKSAMASIIKRDQHAGFNGAWEANLRAMTKVAEYLVNIPKEVLILDRNAFAPTHWEHESTEWLFSPQRGPASPEPVKTTATDPLEVYDAIVNNRRTRMEWEMDFSATYLLHAFGTGKYQRHIHPAMILNRTSNYGVATWEIVKTMVEQGLINGTEGRNYGIVQEDLHLKY